MNLLKRLLPFLLLCLLILPYNIHAAAAGPGGSCGENLTWTLQLDGTLTISGTGAMTDFGPSYAENVSVPWAGNRADIKAVVIEEGVTSIGNNAFVACSNLTSVTLADTVTRIGEHAFQNCPKLAAIRIPNAVTEIGEYAFSGCKALTNVVIPSGVTVIADHTFESCVGLTNVVLTEGVTAIGDDAFKYCPALTGIVIPASVTSIGRSAFEECENFGHVLYTGTQEQWASVTVRSYAFADNVAITYNYTDGMQYHVFQNDCAAKCTHCSFTRDADHTWDEGVDNGEVESGKFTVTFTCTVCGETRVDVTLVDPVDPSQLQPTIPSEPTEPGGPTVPAIQPSSSGTSEPSDKGGVVPIIFVAVVLAAGVAVAVLIIRKKS